MVDSKKIYKYILYYDFELLSFVSISFLVFFKLGQIYENILVRFLVQMKTFETHSEKVIRIKN